MILCHVVMAGLMSRGHVNISLEEMRSLFELFLKVFHSLASKINTI